MDHPPGPADALHRLHRLPGVAEGVGEAREACDRLRRHPAMRRRADEVRAEATVRAAHASAALDGARVDVDVVRAAFAGSPAADPESATSPPGRDAVGSSVRGAVRALAEAQRLGSGWASGAPVVPMQALARLHLAAAAELVGEDVLGRPRREAPGDAVEARLESLASLLRAPADVPALLVAAIAHAEVVGASPFVAGNGVVARALARAVVIGRGLDPTGAAVWEAGLLAAGPQASAALAGYAGGKPAGVAAWLRCWAGAVVAGAAEGRSVADAVLAGRVTQGAQA